MGVSLASNTLSEKKKKENVVTPFEWITDCSSVLPFVESALSMLERKSSISLARVLHVGSGSSVLGETIVETFGSQAIEEMVNCDVDGETLQKMEQQWQAKIHNRNGNGNESNVVKFIQTDFSDESKTLPFEGGHFDLVVDKGTMDCTLCSDLTTAGMLSEIYRLLDPNGGIYILVSFHHVDLLRPLLENLPGAKWHVTHKVMERQVEDLIGKGSVNPVDENLAELMQENKGSGPWATGSFEPDEYYRRFANVFICRRRSKDGPETQQQQHDCHLLDRGHLAEHVHQVNDDWFQQHNPMLTDNRKQEIRKHFQEHGIANNESGGGGELLCDLGLSYKIIFTEEERDHFTYDLFLEDWEAWIAEKGDQSFPADKMTFETAIEFLRAMQ